MSYSIAVLGWSQTILIENFSGTHNKQPPNSLMTSHGWKVTSKLLHKSCIFYLSRNLAKSAQNQEQDIVKVTIL